MNIETIKAAAIEYANLMKVNRDIKELSNSALKKKFGYSCCSIVKAGEGMKPRGMSDDDFDLIRLCIAERERLIKSKNGETRASVAKRYKIRSQMLAEGLEYI